MPLVRKRKKRAPGGPQVDVTLYYVTNRAHEGDRFKPTGYGATFSKDGHENLRFGKVTLRANGRELASYYARAGSAGAGAGVDLQGRLSDVKTSIRAEAFVERVHDAQQRKLGDQKQKLGSASAFTELRDRMATGCDALVLVHGYNVSWEDAVGTAAALQLMLNRNKRDSPVVVILFSWPSDGMMIPWASYKSDRSEAAASGLALARALLKLRDFLAGMSPDDHCNQNLHLLCHSMGNYVLQNAIPRIREHSAGRLPRLFDQIFLCAADVDDDVFDAAKPFNALHVLGSQVNVYYNEDDAALRISDVTKGNPERLGAGGVAHPAQLHRRVHQIDCAPVVGGVVQHSYFLDGVVNRDIRLTLDGKPNPRGRIQGRQPNDWALRTPRRK